MSSFPPLPTKKIPLSKRHVGTNNFVRLSARQGVDLEALYNGINVEVALLK